ncbi:MAG: hypothetical protein PHI99_05510 [Syntrophales bacterium]|nr:hypothetical protein [Syntrophales bacterium]
MKKIWIGFLSVMMMVVWGCGTENNDPTARISSFTAEPSEVAPGGSAVLTVKVVKAASESTSEADDDDDDTTPPDAWGVDVTFRLLTANGGRLSATTQKTDGSGAASVVYTAGNNYSQDVVQAKLENGNSASLVIKKSGSIAGPVISDMQASPTSVTAGQQSIITIEVTDDDKPAAGQYVEITVNPNKSGATLIIPNHYTDAQGRVVATYVAGSAVDVDVTDTVQARVTSSGSVNAVIITVNPSDDDESSVPSVQEKTAKDQAGK